MFQTPTTKVWKRMYDEERLKPPQTFFWEPKPTEELYDLQIDRWEVDNLAGSAAHRDVLERFRRALDAHERQIRDVGLMPEYELHRDESVRTPYERGRTQATYDFDRVYDMAKLASDRAVPLARIRPGLADRDPIVRYWAATGVLVRGQEAVMATEGDLVRLLSDPEPGPQIVAAEALARFGAPPRRSAAVDALIARGDASTNHEYVAMFALYSLGQIAALSDEVKQRVGALPSTPAVAAGQLRQRFNYLPLLFEAIAQGLR
jgi:uncharacterized sulfatase